jgi:hypothetical protein
MTKSSSPGQGLLLALCVLATACCLRSAHADNTSYHRCVGTDSRTRSCLFANLYYRNDQQQFVYFEPKSTVKVWGHYEWTTNFSVGSAATTPDTDPHLSYPFLFLSGYTHGQNDYRAPAHAAPMEPVVVVNPSTMPTEACVIEATTIMTDTAHMVGHFGHWFVDYFYPVVRRLVQFHLIDRQDIQYLAWGSSVGYFKHTLFETFTPLPAKTLLPGDDSIFDCAKGGVCCNQNWVRFKQVVVGVGGASLDNSPDEHRPKYYGSSASSHVWESLRNRLYSRSSTPLPHTASPSGRIVLVKRGGSRRLENVDDMQACLAKRFQNSVKIQEWTALPTARELLTFISDISVLVTSQGTDAFMSVLLPNGAAVINIGTPVGSQWTPFNGWDRFFSEISYLHSLFYPLPPTAVEGKDFTAVGSDQYNFNALTDCERLGDLVEQALDKVARFSSM